MPPLFLLVGQDIPFDNGGVFFDADIASVLGSPGPGVSLVGQEQPQAVAPLPDGTAGAQHIEDDHVAGVVTKTLHGKLALVDDYGVIFHRQAVLSFHIRAAKKPGRVNEPVRRAVRCSVLFPGSAVGASATDPGA